MTAARTPSPALLRARAIALAFAAAGAVLPDTASALCMASGAGCGAQGTGVRFVRPAIVTASPFTIGDRLPDDYKMLMNTRYYGLPAPSDGWVYFRVDHWLYRVDLKTRKILEDATYEANRAF